MTHTTLPRTHLSSTPGSLRAWRNALFAVFALCGISMASWAARIPAVSQTLQLSTAQVGVLLFAAAIGSIAGLIASGHLVATFGARAIMRWALTLGAVAVTGTAFGVTVLSSFAFSFGSLILFGAAMGTCDVAMNVSGAANERALGRSIMPVFHAFFSFGTIIGAGLGALAEALRVPLVIHIGVLAVLSLVVTQIVVRFLLPEVDDDPADDHAAAEPSTWRSRLSIWRDPRTLLIGLIVLGMAFAEGSANDWLSYAMVHGHGTDRPTGAAVFALFVTAMTVGRLAGVRLLDRFGRVPVLRATAVLAAVGLLLVIVVPNVWVSVIGTVLWGLGASLGFPVGMSAAADDPRTAAARVSAVATIGYLAFLVGPPAIGFLGNQFGILNGLLLVLVLTGVAGAVSSAARAPGAPVGNGAAGAGAGAPGVAITSAGHPPAAEPVVVSKDD
ncbi:MFS transporter [Galbitalea soli]|uniref:MFS transporter n=2 Tax=Galbitalea soli TaxID=1268042 RepID=A0A7C9TTG3_9MICO|nr:MFS transporter [Galbitalea soli]NEM92440.1 MFS transporter [Galbitalea soli]